MTSLEAGSANTGGASPTPPMSSEPEAIAWRIGGPDVKSAHLTWRPSLSTLFVLIRPAASSTASAPVPAWSPTFSTTPLSFLAGATTFADGVVADALCVVTFAPASATPRPATASVAVEMSAPRTPVFHGL